MDYYGRLAALKYKFRCLSIIDDHSRNYMAIYVDQGIKDDQLLAVMESLHVENNVLLHRECKLNCVS